MIFVTDSRNLVINIDLDKLVSVSPGYQDSSLREDQISIDIEYTNIKTQTYKLKKQDFKTLVDQLENVKVKPKRKFKDSEMDIL